MVRTDDTIERPGTELASQGRLHAGQTPRDVVLPLPTDKTDTDHAEVWRLVARAQKGDAEAFALLYSRYAEMINRYIYYRVHDRALAEDFTSDTFLRALRRIGTVSYQGRDIGAWLITIARNIVFDYNKSARHRLEISTWDSIEPEGSPGMPSPENTVMDAITSELLMAAIEALGDEQRQCVMLRFVHGLSVTETAEAMGKTEGAVKALQHRAIRKLADLTKRDLQPEMDGA